MKGRGLIASRTERNRMVPSGTILHVTESMGAGVETAIREFVSSTPQFEHHILFCSRDEYRTGDVEQAGFCGVTHAGSGAWSLRRAFLPTVEKVKPDIVHLHSAWAGLVGRTTLRRIKSTIVYSPHSYYFTRTDSSPIVRTMARAIEQLMVHRTALTIAVSPFERDQALSIGAEATYVPNVARVRDLLVDDHASVLQMSDKPMVVSMGRVTNQKDPSFLVAVKHAVRGLGVDADWMWVGGGERSLVALLEDAGIEVTGWVERNRALQLLSAATLYVHTAAWESSPMTLLEVQALQKPVIARSIPSVVSLGYSQGIETPQEMATAIAAFLNGADAVGERIETTPPEIQAEIQSAALSHAYANLLRLRERNSTPANARHAEGCR